MNRKHYVIYFDENRQLHLTTPKDWARQHADEFEAYNFAVKMPTTDFISSYIIDNHDFTRI